MSGREGSAVAIGFTLALIILGGALQDAGLHRTGTAAVLAGMLGFAVSVWTYLAAGRER